MFFYDFNLYTIMNSMKIVIPLAVVAVVGVGFLLFSSAFLSEDSSIHTFPNGAKHEGEWKDGMANGYGIATLPDGSKYEGEFKDNEFHGIGTLTFPDGTKYEGEWKAGLPWTGTITNADGSKTEWRYGQEI